MLTSQVITLKRLVLLCHPEIGAAKSGPEAATPIEISTLGSASLTGRLLQGDFGKDLVHYVPAQTRLSWKDPVQSDAPKVSSPTLSPAFLYRETILCPIPPTVLPLKAGQGRRKDQPTTDRWSFFNNANEDFAVSNASMGWHDGGCIWHIRWCDQVSAGSPEKGRSAGLQTWAVPRLWVLATFHSLAAVKYHNCVWHKWS